MKKLNLLYALLFVASLMACKDDDDETPTFKQADFIGTWEVTKFEGIDDALDSGPCQYEFTQTEMDEAYGCDSGFEISIFAGPYTFDGKNTITLTDADFGKYTLTILELNTTTLKMDQYLDGDKVGTVTATKQ